MDVSVGGGLSCLICSGLVFENMWSNRVVPRGVAGVKVKCIYKGSGDLAEISGHRQISLISCIGKFYTLMWLGDLVEMVAPHISESQGAFIGKAPNLWNKHGQ